MSRVCLIVANVDRIELGDEIVDVQVSVEVLVGAALIAQLIFHERLVLICKAVHTII